MAAEADAIWSEPLVEVEADATHDVALSNSGDSEHNTIVLGGVDLVIPLELDMDGDPFQDDAVCLRSIGGDWEDVRLSSDPDVTVSRDKRHLYYPFHDVPAAVYNVDVWIADRWVSVLTGLRVSQGVARLAGETLTDAPPADSAAVDDPHVTAGRTEPSEPASSPATADDECECGS